MNKKHKIYPLCPKCCKYPKITFDKENNKIILIVCDYCGYNQTEEVHHYVNQMQNVKQAKNENNKCKEHKKIYNSFCTNCNCHL